MTESQEAGRRKSPQFDFPSVLEGVRNYPDLQIAIANAIREMKQDGVKSIGFVSGPLRKEFMIQDMDRMSELSKKLSGQYSMPMISSADIFSVIWDELEETALSPEERKPLMNNLFSEILRSGVTDIFMMDGWRIAPGAVLERETAEEMKIRIQNVPKNN